MELVKVIKNKKYTSANGKEYYQCNFYLVLDNGKWISIKPSFSKNYDVLEVICSKIIDERK